ncbi:MAG: glycosyltransferase family 4 protein, partial [Clostridia bacterium]|nr:glycosyltransferase family 4 protein [Clostridia bacterium]
YISISSLPHVSNHAISLDLLREFKKNGHDIYIVCAVERRENKDTYLSEEDGCKVLRVKIGNNKRANLIEKGITTLMLPKLYIKAINKYFSDVKFDLVLYPTPPITHVNTVKYIKKRDGAKSYLLLKDIFPQNAVDIGMMRKTGLKSVIYKMFRSKEKKLYAVSDYIGCMSDANVEYVLKHNPEVSRDKIEVCPNSVEVVEGGLSAERKAEIRAKYGVPEGVKTFIYGGNLGRPQGIPFLTECLKANSDKNDRFFVICGTGTEYPKLKAFVDEYKPQNVLLLNGLPKAEYEEFCQAFDIGLIFLDHRFTIPNFPSRLLSYMQNKMPVLCVTDPNTDVGKVAVDGGFGWWCESNDVEKFTAAVELAMNEDIEAKGQKGFEYLKNNYTVDRAYDIIMARVGEKTVETV